MCILFLHTNPDPKDNEYRLIVATNRDEYYRRPAKAAFQCPKSGIISGRDMEPGKEGGTWLGFGKKSYPNNGKSSKYCFSCLTNISNHEKVENPTGRGELIVNYLESKDDFPEYMEALRKQGLVFNGFNLIGVELSKDGPTKIYHNSNFPQIKSEYTGKHTLGFGNSAISSPYMKVLNGRTNFEEIIERGLEKEQLKDELVALLKDKTKHLPDVELAKRNEAALEKLSSIFVEYGQAGYGTRTHTIILIDKNWNLEFTELTMVEPIDIENPQWKITVIKSNL
ncbi:transport and Golgi organization protein 2 homolog isoform X1 [Euwallacea fornicatus]|uniref:transport and Golgi organization protein 2 homolog isoform X1 n=2 Tax=Euwallacea fornicatus TaxID=995702 RepID=UPI00338FD30F